MDISLSEYCLSHVLCSELIHYFLENFKFYSRVHVKFGLPNTKKGSFLAEKGNFLIKNK